MSYACVVVQESQMLLSAHKTGLKTLWKTLHMHDPIV